MRFLSVQAAYRRVYSVIFCRNALLPAKNSIQVSSRHPNNPDNIAGSVPRLKIGKPIR